MSEKTLNGTDKVPYEQYHKLENEIFWLVDRLESVGVRGTDRPRQTVINIRYLQKGMTDELAEGNLSSEAMKVVNKIIARWQNDPSNV